MISGVNQRFGLEFRTLDATESDALQRAKDLAVELHNLYAELGGSNEIECAKARLEEAAMWASKHIALNGVREH